MLRRTSDLTGFKIAARDGNIGTVSDFLFDDMTWMVRWMVVDTGHWLPGRKVLLPPNVLGHVDMDGEEFSVRLTRAEISGSPDIDTDKSVSRQMETNVYDYYGWSPYWDYGVSLSPFPYASDGFLDPTPIENMGSRPGQSHGTDDPHLRSVNAVTGYHVHATDGDIGHIENFLVEEVDWCVHYLIVDTKNWWPGKSVLISPRSVRQINWLNRLVDVSASRKKIQDSPAYDPAIHIDRTFERHFRTYYGGAGADRQL